MGRAADTRVGLSLHGGHHTVKRSMQKVSLLVAVHLVRSHAQSPKLRMRNKELAALLAVYIFITYLSLLPSILAIPASYFQDDFQDVSSLDEKSPDLAAYDDTGNKPLALLAFTPGSDSGEAIFYLNNPILVAKKTAATFLYSLDDSCGFDLMICCNEEIKTTSANITDEGCIEGTLRLSTSPLLQDRLRANLFFVLVEVSSHCSTIHVLECCEKSPVSLCPTPLISRVLADVSL